MAVSKPDAEGAKEVNLLYNSGKDSRCHVSTRLEIDETLRYFSKYFICLDNLKQYTRYLKELVNFCFRVIGTKVIRNKTTAVIYRVAFCHTFV